MESSIEDNEVLTSLTLIQLRNSLIRVKVDGYNMESGWVERCSGYCTDHLIQYPQPACKWTPVALHWAVSAAEMDINNFYAQCLISSLVTRGLFQSSSQDKSTRISLVSTKKRVVGY